MARAESRLNLLDRRLWRHPECVVGMRDMARVVPGMIAWGMVTGVAMAKSLPLSVAVMMSLMVFSAGAQLAAMPLMLAGAPLWVVWLTALCVNLRFVIFSARLRTLMIPLPLPWRLFAGYLCADVTFVLTAHKYGDGPAPSPGHVAPLAYFAGVALVNWGGWNIASLCGVLFAAWIPEGWGLQFAGTLALLALLVTLCKDGTTAVTAGLAGTAAIAAYGLPYRLNIVVSVAAAVACGLLMDEASKMLRGRAASPDVATARERGDE